MGRRQANNFGKNRHLGGRWADKLPFPHKPRHALLLGLLHSPNTVLSQLAPSSPLAMGVGGFSGWGSQAYDSLNLGKSGDFPPTWHPERWQKIRPFAAEEPVTFLRGSQAELPPTLQSPYKTLTVLSLIPTSCIQGQLEGLSPSLSKKSLDVHDVCIQHPHSCLTDGFWGHLCYKSSDPGVETWILFYWHEVAFFLWKEVSKCLP